MRAIAATLMGVLVLLLADSLFFRVRASYLSPPHILHSAWPNGLLSTATIYGGYRVSDKHAIRVMAITGRVTSAGTGSGNVEWQVNDGTNTCTCEIACNATGNVRSADPCAGTCIFAAGSSLVLRTKTEADCTVYPTMQNVEVEVQY